MINPIHSILSRTNQGRRPLKILCQPIHEAYATLLSYTGHQFYMLQGDHIKQWDYHTKPLPPNYYLLKQPFPTVGNDLQFDLLFSQERYSNLQRFLQISKAFKVPLVHVDHALIPPGITKQQADQIKALRADAHVFVAEAGRESWGGLPTDEVIRYGLDTEVFKGWHGTSTHGISVVNHFASRDVFCGWKLWQEVASQIPMKLVGENPGISESAKSTQHLVEMLAEARFFLNTSQYSTFPLTIPEAMAVGCPVISTAKQEIPRYIRHGENGFLADTPEEMISYAKLLMEDHDLARKIGEAGRQTVIENFAMDVFVEKWNKVFYGTLESYK